MAKTKRVPSKPSSSPITAKIKSVWASGRFPHFCLLPVVGVTLPFLSYGGSALIATYLGIGFIASSALNDPEIKSEVRRFVAERIKRK